MIVINKEEVSTILILPQLDKAYTAFRLTLHSDYTKTDTTIDLGDNYAQSSTRYTKFFVANSIFKNLPSGEYEYVFLGDEEVITIGLMAINSSEDKVVYQTATPIKDDNDFYVLNTN